MTRSFRTYAQVSEGSDDIVAQVTTQLERVAARLAPIQHVVIVASGKGGVGKSVVTANLAAALAAAGRSVGVLDADLNGPSVATMLGAARTPLHITDDGVAPAEGVAGVRVMSMDLLLASPDAPLRWREPDTGAFVWQSTLETGALREFIADTNWGTLDYLLIDLPPGTDKITRVLSLVPQPAALLLVTTPAHAATAVVARSITHARDAGARTIALVSNMDGYSCAQCGAPTPLFHAGGGAQLAARCNVPLWGVIPFEPELSRATDAGQPIVRAHADTAAARALAQLADTVEQHVRAPAHTPASAT